ncbi:MAG: TolC family protein [Nitrospiraceae bacterium]|jgi:outer membrane protein TolC|uniref:TolC family protein n=1 Tax=Nitrospira cf. moscoviensis SBR1015 TaxID=96242 RepID=UPI000A09D11C|nr:TolC family protein [Nitrospira cf. moscoviensis SBR1015]MBY0249167.1 TolC family protein [Nitrospiraceae bacterium]OQW34359.1 MAG: transporter [Nitrospira sp. SG-bin2]
MRVLSFILGWLLLLPAVGYSGQVGEVPAAESLPPIPFSLDELHARIDRTHPLLKGAGAEKTIARGKMLKALGAFEPTLVNDTELERFISSADPSKGTQTVGYNDTLVEALHPSGFKGSAGFRQAIGDARIPDLSFGNGNQQVILGGYLPLLRGLMINPERAELQRSELANPLADIKIAQTRQGLFLAAAHQFWEWVSAAKLLDIQKRAVAVAEARYKQVEERAKAGVIAPIDVTEAGQEVHRRREVAIAARRLLEQEQFKLSMFLWDNGSPTIPPIDRVPEFPPAGRLPTPEDIMAHKLAAMEERPEVKELDVEAKINNIDLALAKNNLLPSLDLEAAPARSPEKFVLGLGYRFGVELRIPLMQRRGRGEVLQAQGQAERLVMAQQYRENQVLVDVDNAFSAIERARERIEEAVQALRLVEIVEEGERYRFSVGASSVLFVNLRERNTIDSENQVIRAKAEYYKALAQYQWAIGAWAKGPNEIMRASYR